MRPLVLAFAIAMLVTAGCLGDAVPPEAASAEAPASEASMADGTLVPVSLDGRVESGAWVCAAPIGWCQGVADEGERTFPLDFDGTLRGVSVELAWEATTPAMATLRFGLMWTDRGETAYEMVEGTSPLVLELESLDLAPRAEPTLWVWTPNRAAPGEAYASHEQAFHIEGALALAR